MLYPKQCYNEPCYKEAEVYTSFLVMHIAPDMVLFSQMKSRYFSYFSTKTYVLGIHQKCLAEALLMNTNNNIRFSWRNKKTVTWILPLI